MAAPAELEESLTDKSEFEIHGYRTKNFTYYPNEAHYVVTQPRDIVAQTNIR